MFDKNIVIYEEFIEKCNTLKDDLKKVIKNVIRDFEDENLTINDCYKNHNQADEKIYLYDINEKYTIAYAHLDNNTLIFLYIASKSEINEWVILKRCDLNTVTNSIQLYTVSSMESVCKKGTYLFDKYSDEQLIKISVPIRQIDFVRTIENYEDLENKRYCFESNVYEILSQLALNNDYNYALEKLKSYKNEKANSYGEAIVSNLSRRSFMVVNGENELKDIINAPLEKWRVFLHPDQRNYVENDYAGSVKITGAAGTGKTVVAMHRAKHLINKGKRVLFTTFNKALTKDIEFNLSKIVSPTDMKKIEITNIDSLTLKFAKSKGMSFNLVYEENELRDMWDQAIKTSNTELTYDKEFYLREWREIYSVLNNMELEEYYNAKRKGTGIRVNKSIRKQIKEVFDSYINIMNKNNLRDIDFLLYECRKILREEKKYYYDSIVIDELQDMSLNQLKFLRLLVKEGENDMFMVGDSRQRIYNSKISVEQANIDVKNRSFELHVNYRTTEEIKNVANMFLGSMDIDNMEEENDKESKSISLTHGNKPIVKNFKTFEEQMEYVKEEMKILAKLNAKLQDICIVSRSSKEIEKIEEYLKKENISAQVIDVNSVDDETSPRLKLSTMHRIKGLEFRYIFILSINDNLFPLITSSSDNIQSEYKNDIEKSLLYVSMTRAQKQAYLLSYGKPSSLIESHLKFQINDEDVKDTDEYIKNNIINNDKYSFLKTKSISELIDEYEEKSTWAHVLQDFIIQKGKSNHDIYFKIGMSKQKFSRLINNETKVVKDDILGFAFALGLSVEEATKLLNKAGFAFTKTEPRDLIIMAYMARGDYDISHLNNELISRKYRYLYDK